MPQMITLNTNRLLFAAEVERCLHEAGITRDELCRLSGVSRKTLYLIMYGKTNVSIDAMVSIATALNKKLEINLKST